LKNWQETFQKKMTRMRGGAGSTDVEVRLNGELRLIQAHDGKVKGFYNLLRKKIERRQ
jgi:hypothetical protein